MIDTPVDFIVKTAAPDLLDSTVQQLPACTAMVVEGSWNGESCRLRVLSGAGFLRFAISQQGYGQILAEEAIQK